MKTEENNLIKELQRYSTPTICNAIERLKTRLRNEGYAINTGLENRNPQAQPMVGYAITLHMRTANPPIKGRTYQDREDWWDVVLSLPSPRIAVIQDLDFPSAAGSVVGIIHALIFKALGCNGIVTNGAVRDVSLIQKEKIHLYSSELVPSHAYSHIVEVGKPVTIAGLAIKQGDLLHGDVNGITSLPLKSLKDILLNAQQIQEKEKNIIEFYHSKEFTLKKLKELVKEYEV